MADGHLCARKRRIQMRPAALLFAMLVSISAIPVHASSAEAVAARFCPAGRSALVLPAGESGHPDLRKNIFSSEGGNVQYKDGVCTVFYDCPSGQQISCSGTSCSTTTVTCSAQGSTCPQQGGSVGAVYCDGSVRASCPCPEVCFGCGHSCTSNSDCDAVCTCGSGSCFHGSCTCPF
jgi:hypothetical protein